jgi:hypothetical protein
MTQPKVDIAQVDVLNTVVQVVSGTLGAFSGVTTIPFDNTVPEDTEGTQIGSGAITPSSASSKILIQAVLNLDASVNNTDLVIALFRGSTCIAASVVTVNAAGNPTFFARIFVDAPATTSPVTYSGRIGRGSGSATWYVNSTSSGNDLGGVLSTTFVLQEISG